MRTVMICFALMAGSAFGQNPPEKAVKDIRDVQIGMSRDHVVSGLSGRYKCSKVGEPARGAEIWSVSPKDDPKRVGELESASILFVDGKARTVGISLHPTMTGEAAQFADRLFWLIYNKADLPINARERSDTLLNKRYATLPVELQDTHDEKSQNLFIIFNLGGQTYSIGVRKRRGLPDEVNLMQHFPGATTDRK
jgi:hypothetical protein